MMKLLKKATMLLCVCAVAVPLVSCGNNSSNTKESTPEEALKTYVDVYKRAKDINYDAVGTKEEDLKDLVAKRDYNLTLILMLDNDKQEDKEFWESVYNNLEKVEVNVKNSDIKDNKASLEISAKGIDLDKIHINSLTNTKKKGHEKQTGDKKSGDIYMEYVKEELASGELGEEKTYTINLEKNSEGKWALASDSIATLESAITTDDSYEAYGYDVPEEFKEALPTL